MLLLSLYIVFHCLLYQSSCVYYTVFHISYIIVRYCYINICIYIFIHTHIYIYIYVFEILSYIIYYCFDLLFRFIVIIISMYYFDVLLLIIFIIIYDLLLFRCGPEGRDAVLEDPAPHRGARE